MLYVTFLIIEREFLNGRYVARLMEAQMYIILHLIDDNDDRKIV